MSISHLYPSISPSLSLNFARSKTLDPRITFSRTTTATRVNETGLIEVMSADEPRFDHRYENGVVKSLGLLVEEQRSNLVTDNSTDFNYSISNQIIATALDTAPDGNIVLCKHDLTGATSPFLNCRANTTLSSGNTYTMSMWLKGTTNFSASFAFVGETTSEIYSNTANVTTEWKRFTLTFTLTNTQTLSRLQVFFAQQGEGKVISIWGAQLELGSFATTYIPRPTAGQQATRTVDAVSMTGTNFSDWYNQDEGTVYTELSLLDVGNTGGKVLWSINQVGGFGEGFYMVNENNQTSIVYNAFYGSSSQAQFGGPTGITTNQYYKTIFSYQENNVNACFDGNVGTADTSVGIATVGRLTIGNNAWGNILNPGDCHIKSFIYYPKRLTNTQLQNLTK